MTYTRTKVGEVKGWEIIVNTHATYEAKKPGETVVLAAGMIHEILELINQREKGASDDNAM